MDVSMSLESHLECPICTEVPRDGVMLQCLNGHNVCFVCKNKLDEGAKCPQGRCDFGTPPVRNLLAANLIGNFFKWPCKYRKESGCEFEGAGAPLVSHETDCIQQLVPCPNSYCNELVSLGTVVKHLDTAHDLRADVNTPACNQGSDKFEWQDSYSSYANFAWYPRPYALDCVEWALLCIYMQEGHLFLWMWALTDDEEEDKLECKIVLHNADGSATVFSAPVYPLTWDRQKVMGDDRCVHLPGRRMKEMLTQEGLSEECKNKGRSDFAISFEVSRKCM